MHKLYVSSIIFAFLLCHSFSTNPPDGNTGAPGENLCTQCHESTGATQQGTITVEGFPGSITPGETYNLTAVNRLTEGAAVRGGFQVTILGPSNARAGDFLNPSSTSAVTIDNGRQYWDHDPALEYPDSNVVRWTVQWKAPELPSGTQITWYAAGNIANGNFQNTQDRIVTATGSGSIVLLSNNEPVQGLFTVYPNPGTHEVKIVAGDRPVDGSVYFHNLEGRTIDNLPLLEGSANTSSLPPGLYLLEVRQNGKSNFVRWSKIE